MSNLNLPQTNQSRGLSPTLSQLFGEPKQGNKWTGRFCVETINSKEILHGNILDYQAFIKVIESSKFVRLGNVSVAVHQIISFYPEQEELTNDERMKIMMEKIKKDDFNK